MTEFNKGQINGLIFSISGVAFNFNITIGVLLGMFGILHIVLRNKD